MNVRSKLTYPTRWKALAMGVLRRSVAARMRGTPCAARIRVPSARISQPAPADCGMIALTVPETGDSYPPCCLDKASRTWTQAPVSPGAPGAYATRPQPAGTTTTDATHSSRNPMSDHEVRLPYQLPSFPRKTLSTAIIHASARPSWTIRGINP